MRLKTLLFSLLLVLLAAAAALAAPQRHVLPSGLTVITSENHEAPVVTFQVWVRAGSAFERPHEYGITHLIEHMIFKGSPRYPDAQMARRIEALGGEVNAYTTLDHTNYYVTVASQNGPEALELLADAVVNASFADKDLAKEKEVVVEEIRMGQDSPARRRSKAVMRLAFGPSHPYGRPVIGSIESVRAITRQNILDYRSRWYRAPGMVVVAVGDFNTKKLMPRIKKAFAGLSSQPAPAFKLPPMKQPKGPRLLVMREKVRQAALTVSWLIPGLPSPQVYALDMAATVAGEGETSRLYSQLKEKQGLVDGVSAFSYTPKGAGLFQVSAACAPDKVARAWRPLLKQTLSLISSPPRPEELARARVNLTASFTRDRQTMSGQARTLGYFEMMRGGFEKAQDYLRRFQALGAAQVAEAAKLNLTPQNLSVVIQVPEGAPVFNQEELVKAAKELTPSQIAPPPRDAEKARRQVLANGLVLITQPRRAVPLVAMTLAAPGGQANESGDQAGLYNLWSRTLTRGSQNRTYEQLTRELEDMAGALSAFSGKSTCGLAGDFLASDYKRGLELLAETWLTPSFPPAQIKKAKAEQMAALRRQQDSPVSRTFLAFRPLFYGDHPYGHNPLGSPQKVASFTREDLLAAHRRVMGPGGAVLTVVGNINPEEVKLQVERLFGAHKGKVNPARPGPVPPPSAPRNQAITDPKAKQTQIVLGYPGPSATDPGRHALNLISAMLGGMGGRLFSDLRDQRSLAYAVQPFYSNSKDAGVLGVYMAVGPGKVNEAIAGLNQHLDRLRRQPPASGELERAKAYVLGGLAIGLQSYSAQASIMAADELLGLGYDFHLKLPQDIKAVTKNQILKAAKLVLNPSHRVKLTLGP